MKAQKLSADEFKKQEERVDKLTRPPFLGQLV